MNVHTPERQPNETQAQYRERQARSKLINQRLTLSTPDARTWACEQKRARKNSILKEAQS